MLRLALLCTISLFLTMLTATSSLAQPFGHQPHACYEYAPVAPVTGQRITFDGSCSLDGVLGHLRLVWDFGDNTPRVQGVSVAHVYLTPDNYTVILRVVAPHAHMSEVSSVVVVRSPVQAPKPRACYEYHPSPPTPGDSITFNGMCSVFGTYQYLDLSWRFDDGLQSGDSVRHVFRTPGDHRVTLRLIEPDAQSVLDSTSLVVTVHPSEGITPFDTGSGLGSVNGRDQLPRWLTPAAILAVIGLLAWLAWRFLPTPSPHPSPLVARPLELDDRPLAIGDALLRTPGLKGRVRVHEPRAPAFADLGLISPELRTALDRRGWTIEKTIEITNTREVRGLRSGEPTERHGEPALCMELLTPAPGREHVLLYSNESGVLSWILPQTPKGEFLLRRHVPGASQAPLRRLVPAVGKKVIHVLAFKAVEAGVQAGGAALVRLLEPRFSPGGIRWFTPADYREANGVPVDADGWRRLSRGRALLFVHGTFSRAHGAFSAIPEPFMRRLDRHYEGRVFAFDHPTVSEDPRQNVEWFVRQVPEDSALELDIVCHSRGGLVSRVLAEKQDELPMGSRRIRVRSVVFVASPNAGTVLTEGRYVLDLLDSYTNFLNWFPHPAVIDTLESVLAVLTQIAGGAADRLDGLQSMRPDGPFLRWLNVGPRGPSAYFALASDFEPTRSGVKDALFDALMDKIFAARNDLIVPTSGVWDKNGSGCFPIVARHVFESDKGVWHSGFFENATAQEMMSKWLMEERGSGGPE